MTAIPTSHAAGLLLAAAVALTGCSVGAGNPDDLRSRPEAALAPPGAELISDGGSDATSGIEGPVNASWGSTYEIDMDPQAVRDWYVGQLGPGGWKAHQLAITSFRLPLVNWCRDGDSYELQLQFWDDDLDPPTEYTFRLQGREAEALCIEESPLPQFHE